MSQELLQTPILEKRTYEIAPTLESVQTELMKRGYNWDLPSVCHQALHDWYLHNRRRGIRSTGLPATTVEDSGVRYYVHGIPHYGQTTDVVRKYIRNELGGYVDLGHTVLIEQELVSFIFRAYIGGIKFPMTFVSLPVVEMDDADWAKDVNPEAFKRYIERTKSDSPTNYGSMNGGCNVCSHIQADVADTKEKFLRNPTFLADLQNLAFSTLLPEQLNRQYLELFYLDDALMISDRSRRMAEFASQYRTQSQEIDIIVGVGHQPGIPYYLLELERLNQNIK